MKVKFILWFVISLFHVTSTLKSGFDNYDYDLDFKPEIDDAVGLNIAHPSNKYRLNGLVHSDMIDPSEPSTECVTINPRPSNGEQQQHPPRPEQPEQSEHPEQQQQQEQQQQEPQQQSDNKPQATNGDKDEKAKELNQLVQLMYIAQARVQLEATEIKKAQAVANSAQQTLEDAANHVRTITASLQSTQQEVASAAIRAQTAQLQLAAHDQLLFAARQDLDALSSQMVALQAVEGISEPKLTVNLNELLQKLKQPLSEAERPTPIPSVVQLATRHLPQPPQNNHKVKRYKGQNFKQFYYD